MHCLPKHSTIQRSLCVPVALVATKNTAMTEINPNHSQGFRKFARMPLELNIHKGTRKQKAQPF